jgi:type 1 glutamine amidotransferase
MKREVIVFLFAAVFLFANAGYSQTAVLIYTKNGKGYVHDNIPYAVSAIRELCEKEGYAVSISDDPAVFKEENLRKYQVLVFPSTNNDVFDTEQQRLSFRRFIESGGGLVGLHSVTGTERNWRWFKMLIGCTFAWHAPFQRFNVCVTDRGHPSMQGVPLMWSREDELYFGKELYPVTNVLMAHQITSLDPAQNEQVMKNAGGYTEYYPAVWYNSFQGGHAWISTLGHSKESYSDPVYLNHLLQGLRFVVKQVKEVDFKRAYADKWDDDIRLP